MEHTIWLAAKCSQLGTSLSVSLRCLMPRHGCIMLAAWRVYDALNKTGKVPWGKVFLQWWPRCAHVMSDMEHTGCVTLTALHLTSRLILYFRPALVSYNLGNKRTRVGSFVICHSSKHADLYCTVFTNTNRGTMNEFSRKKLHPSPIMEINYSCRIISTASSKRYVMSFHWQCGYFFIKESCLRMAHQLHSSVDCTLQKNLPDCTLRNCILPDCSLPKMHPSRLYSTCPNCIKADCICPNCTLPDCFIQNCTLQDRTCLNCTLPDCT